MLKFSSRATIYKYLGSQRNRHVSALREAHPAEK
jgi:hypothetical protein